MFRMWDSAFCCCSSHILWSISAIANPLKLQPDSSERDERNSAQRPRKVLSYSVCPRCSHSPGCQLYFIRALQVCGVIQDGSHRWRATEWGRDVTSARLERGERTWQTTLIPQSLLDSQCRKWVESMQWKWRVYDGARDDAGNCSWKPIGSAHVERGRAALSQEYWLEARCLQPLSAILCVPCTTNPRLGCKTPRFRNLIPHPSAAT